MTPSKDPIMGVIFLVYLSAITPFLPISMAQTNSTDLTALIALRNQWDNTPPNWKGDDPCGQGWLGIYCNNETRVTAIILAGLNVKGYLPTEILSLSELVTLDLSNNPSLTGLLPQDIGNLKKLVNLLLLGCNFFGPIPESIGSMSKLSHLFLNSNRFNGTIPHSIGNLLNLIWLDLSDNQLTGTLPVSNETASGLNKLLTAKHFHLGNNKLSGEIPQDLFTSGMRLQHFIVNQNKLNGSIPETLGHVPTLEVLRLDSNAFTHSVPGNLSDLKNLTELYLSNNLLTGSMPNFIALTKLAFIDLSNNSFDASETPAWLSALPNLTTILLENVNLQGNVPDLFNLSNLQTVVLRHNNLNGNLNVGAESADYSSRLRLIDLQNNSIGAVQPTTYNKLLLLYGNPTCVKNETVASLCIPGLALNYKTHIPGSNCTSVSCSSNQLPGPDCKCAIPYIGNMVFLAFSFSDLNDTASYFTPLANTLVKQATSLKLPIDSVSLIVSTIDTYGYLNLTVAFFPAGEEKFNSTGISLTGNYLNNHIYSPPDMFGPFQYLYQPPESVDKKTKIAIIVGVTVSISLLILLVLTGVYAYRQRKIAQEADRRNNPFASWDSKGGGEIPQINEARWFSFEDIKSSTNDFSEVNEIGHGGYGMVYRGILSGGRLVAIKRAQQGSMQGALEFKTEIELLSRVHHKNIVNLVGFCYDKGEQMLVYEYMAGGNLSSLISGKSKGRLDWTDRLTVALGAARGLAYLHDFADPPIIHRDVKSNNILLDNHLNAKVADFGLSKLVNHQEKYQEATDVKGTMGYLDPDYFSNQILTTKSDVYSFGVVLLELLTGKRPIENRMHIVRYVRETMDQTRELQSLVDPSIDSDLPMPGLKEFVDVAMRCVEESSLGRPTMGEVVRELEKIMELGDLNSRTRGKRLSSAVSLEVMSEGSTYYTSTDYAALNHSGGTPLLR